ncbi:MAG: 4-hydroxy-tetrahydrodipicolinate synthase [Paludibacteraceae bacterium]|nr:4-hydroxy-tetrahydrodipicolinate synthase [Paludibacteraceae bacterium]
MDKLKGLGTALITPFKPDKSIDYEALARVLDTQLTGFVDYLVVLGTTGEAATLTCEEKREVRRFIVDYVRNHPVSSLEGRSGRVLPLVLGVGGNNTAQVISDLKAMKDELILDFTAILSVCPYYNKPNQEGLYQHFCAVAEASPIPVILYNVPGRTGVNLLPETVIRIYNAHPDKIAGIKEASGNLDQIKHLLKLINAEGNKRSEGALRVISGDDGIACEVMAAGGAGLISVASNAFPEDFWHIVHDQDAALQARYTETIRLLFAEGNPVGIKAVLANKGLIGNNLRLPLVPASPELQHQLA